MRLTLLFSLLLAAVAATAKPFDSADFNTDPAALEIQRITPAGKDVRPARQMVFQFNRPVVPVGKMERDASEIPVTIMPALDCQWRWLNTSALACQLGEKNAMIPATRYRVLMRPGIEAEDGTTLSGPVTHEFVTERPEVKHYRFETWLAPGMPLIRVSFNQAVARDSVQRHLFLNKNGQRIHVRAVAPTPSYRYTWVLQDRKGDLVPEAVLKLEYQKAEEGEEGAKRHPALKVGEQPDYGSVWVLSPLTLLGEDERVQLRMEAGLKSEKGPERGIESRTVVEFDTFPPFEFLGVRCDDNAEQEVIFAPSAKPSTERRCNPQQRVALRFSAPVIPQVLKKNLEFTPDLTGGRKDYDPWERLGSWSRLSQPHKRGQVYEVYVPELLKAYETYRLQASVANFEDEFGRPLIQPVDMRFRTDHRVPSYAFEHNISVLEKDVDSEVPIYVTNLERIDFSYDRLDADGVKKDQKYSEKVSKIKDIAFKKPLHVRKMLDGKSGVVDGRLSTAPHADNRAYAYPDNWFFAQVTPFHVQVKLGHYNTLVWITDFATGKPVAGVHVGVYEGRYGTFSQNSEIRTKGVSDADGLVVLDGIEKIDPELKLVEQYRFEEPRLFLRCEKDEDTALLALDHRFAVGTYELSEDYLYTRHQRRYGHIHTWGTTAQGVYKVGDTIQYKILVRDQDNRRFVPAPQKGYTLKIEDPTGKTVQEIKDIELSEFGGYGGEFTLPKTAAVGWYDFYLSAEFLPDHTWTPLRVLVSDFTPSPFRVHSDLNGKLFHANAEVTVDTRAVLHAGGPYAEAAAQVYAMLKQDSFETDDPNARGFYFDTYVDVYDEENVHHSETQLNAKGELQTVFTLPDSEILYGKLKIESTVRDDRGKDVAARTSARYVGRDRFVGLKQTSWVVQEDKPGSMLYLVVDEHGKVAPGSAVEVAIERRVTKASRVKGAGNAYLTHYVHEWEKAGECSGTSGAEGRACEFTPEHAGSYRLTATIKDTQGRAHSTTRHQWVAGKGRVIWDTATGNGMEITPEKKTYHVGDTARYLVKNPFPGAQALITVERYGVLKHWTTVLENSVEIVEIPVEPDYLPGFFVSVTVMSPRVDKPIDDEGVDLGKPAFRMGYAQTTVADPYKQLTVDIASDRPVYRPGDKVTLDFQAKPKQPEGFDEAVELAVAVLDESVFDLIAAGLDYFDPYKGFYTLDGLDLQNFNILLNLVGRQKFEKKGANPGGDGGLDLAMRSLFKFVSYWNPSLETDAEGKAQVQFEAPDNLTGWRVLAMAVTPSDRMGLGDYNFKVNQPIELRPVMPNQITVGDTFEAGFSVMNRTEQARKVKVDLTANGPIAIPAGSKEVLAGYSLDLKPFKRHTVWLPLKSTGPGDILLSARATDGKEQDALSHTLVVRKKRALETGATYGTTVSNEVTESIQFPADIHPDAGGLSVIASPTVIGNVEGAFEYMRDYPYVCWEQKLSKGVMASHYTGLKAWLPDTLEWGESAGLAQKTLGLAAEYQAPNGGMVYFIPSDERVSPYLSAYTGVAFNWLRAAKLNVPAEVEKKLHGYLETFLRKDVQPSFYTPGMSSTVRAVALAALAPHGKLSLADLNRYHSHVPRMSLFGKSQFLDAALRVEGSDKMRKETADLILSQANESGGKISFVETLDDAYTRILASSLRDNCAILGSLSRYAETDQGRGVGQVPMKLARYITSARGSRTHWENTQENLFCMNALIEYARVFEKDKPDMQVRAFLAQEKLGETKFTDVRDPQAEFEHEMTAQDVGRKASVKIEREGQGRVYYGVRLRYAPLEEKAERVDAGFDLRREYHVERGGKWVLLNSPMTIKTGELVRVDLYLSLPAARNFVVVDDPVPGGLEPVDRNLATASEVAADKARGDYEGGSYWYKHDGWREYGLSFWSFYHKELRHHAAIFYADWLEAGNYHLGYTAQAIAPGEFVVMPVHAEEMYEPDVYGKGLPARLVVEKVE